MGIEEVDRENEAGGEQGLVRMNDRGHVEDHPGRKRLKNSGNQSINPESPMATSPRRQRESQTSPVGPAVKAGLGPLLKTNGSSR